MAKSKKISLLADTRAGRIAYLALAAVLGALVLKHSTPGLYLKEAAGIIGIALVALAPFLAAFALDERRAPALFWVSMGALSSASLAMWQAPAGFAAPLAFLIGALVWNVCFAPLTCALLVDSSAKGGVFGLTVGAILAAVVSSWWDNAYWASGWTIVWLICFGLGVCFAALSKKKGLRAS